jgi:GntR family transcriptional repressor for pyruvate dehydrogenase complex
VSVPLTLGSNDEQVKIVGEPILRPREQVEDRLKAAILSGEVPSGWRLPPESELAKQFSVSRNTIREALRTLATERLIHKVPGAGGGSFVRAVDSGSLGTALSESMSTLLTIGSINYEEVAIVRQLLEVPAVRMAAEHRDSADMDKLYNVLNREKSISVTDPDVPILDAEFHSTIADASRNRVLASFVAALHRQTEPVRYLDLSPEVGQTTVRQHQRIAKAIGDGDADEGEAAIIEHLTYLRRHLLAWADRPKTIERL